MSGSEAIINKILKDAESAAKNYLDDAEEKASTIMNEAKETVAEYQVKSKAELEKEIGLIAERKNTVATLDVRKILLASKQRVIDECFEKAKKSITEGNGERYVRFISSQIEKYGEDGDEVVLSKNEDKIDESVIKTISDKMKIKLSLSKTRGEFDGGVILVSRDYDKNLTLDTLMRTLREEIEQEVANTLFEKVQ